MQPPELGRFVREDAPTAPEWFFKFLGVYNQFFDALYRGLDKKITFEENLDIEYREVQVRRLDGVNDVRADEPFKFVSEIQNDAKGVTVVQAIKLNTDRHEPLPGPVTVDWREEAGEINIYEIFNLSTSVSGEERFLVRIKVE